MKLEVLIIFCFVGSLMAEDKLANLIADTDTIGDSIYTAGMDCTSAMGTVYLQYIADYKAKFEDFKTDFVDGTLAGYGPVADSLRKELTTVLDASLAKMSVNEQDGKKNALIQNPLMTKFMSDIKAKIPAFVSTHSNQFQNNGYEFYGCWQHHNFVGQINTALSDILAISGTCSARLDSEINKWKLPTLSRIDAFLTKIQDLSMFMDPQTAVDVFSTRRLPQFKKSMASLTLQLNESLNKSAYVAKKFIEGLINVGSVNLKTVFDGFESKFFVDSYDGSVDCTALAG